MYGIFVYFSRSQRTRRSPPGRAMASSRPTAPAAAPPRRRSPPPEPPPAGWPAPGQQVCQQPVEPPCRRAHPQGCQPRPGKYPEIIGPFRHIPGDGPQVQHRDQGIAKTGCLPAVPGCRNRGWRSSDSSGRSSARLRPAESKGGLFPAIGLQNPVGQGHQAHKNAADAQNFQVIRRGLQGGRPLVGYSSSRMGRARTLSPTPAGRASRAVSRKAAAVCRPAADRSPGPEPPRWRGSG